MRKKGFTLIELVVVMAIMAIVAAVVLPRLDPFVPSRRLKSAARTLSGTITLAYGESIARNKTYRLYLDPSKDMYRVVEVQQLESDDQGGAIGIKLGTHFELLQYDDSRKDAEESTPTEPLFAPQKLPQGVHISSVNAGNDITLAAAGEQYIEFSPLGVASPASITLVNEDGEALSLQYDGVTGVPSLSVSSSGT
jgi:type II secretion system protein H